MMSADSASPDVPLLRKEVACVPEKYTELRCKLQEQEAGLEKTFRDASLFHKEMGELEVWVTEAAESTAVQAPISTNPAVVNKRLEQTEVCAKTKHFTIGSFLGRTCPLTCEFVISKVLALEAGSFMS